MIQQDQVRRRVRECQAVGRLTTWEANFLEQIHRGRWITDKQAATVEEIWQRRCGVKFMRGGRR